jgi:hypothetical protein
MATLFYVVYTAATTTGGGSDAEAYWLARDYTSGVDTPHAFLYSPVLLQLLAPLQLLPWQAFHVLWAILLGLALVYMLGPLSAPALLIPPVAQEFVTLNVHLPLAALIVAGFRWPSSWALVLLTKITPGIGLIWFGVRGKWRHVGVALATTLALTAVSFVLAPQLWFDWLQVLRISLGTNVEGHLVPIPLSVRLPFAVVVAWAGAVAGWRWTVPVAAMLALPVLWVGALSMLLAIWPLRARHDDARQLLDVDGILGRLTSRS